MTSDPLVPCHWYSDALKIAIGDKAELIGKYRPHVKGGVFTYHFFNRAGNEVGYWCPTMQYYYRFEDARIWDHLLKMQLDMEKME